VSGKKYWRSLDDRADGPEYRAFVEREFPTFIDEQVSETSRRRFLQIMGASAPWPG
jgi:molybdopterin-containing oxidoreductase family iron-sulfur binding subunit